MIHRVDSPYRARLWAEALAARPIAYDGSEELRSAVGEYTTLAGFPAVREARLVNSESGDFI